MELVKSGFLVRIFKSKGGGQQMEIKELTLTAAYLSSLFLSSLSPITCIPIPPAKVLALLE
jgi:hypothetical protein